MFFSDEPLEDVERREPVESAVGSRASSLSNKIQKTCKTRVFRGPLPIRQLEFLREGRFRHSFRLCVRVVLAAAQSWFLASRRVLLTRGERERQSESAYLWGEEGDCGRIDRESRQHRKLVLCE